MSKASEWVKKCAEARAIGPKQFQSPEGTEVRGAFYAEVDYLTGRLKFNNDRSITANEALRLAAWITENFGEASGERA